MEDTFEKCMLCLRSVLELLVFIRRLASW